MESPTDSFIGNHVLDRRIRTTLSNAKITLCELNLTTRIIHWSVDQSFHFFEFSKSYDGTFDGYFKLIHDDDKERVAKSLEHLNLDEYITLEHRVLWTDGTYHWLEGIGKYYQEDGMSLLIGTIQDITERKRLEIEREDWERRHKLVADAAGVIVYDYDIESGSIIWSGNVKHILSFSNEEMGDINRWGDLIHPDDRESTFKALEEAQSQLKTFEVYYRFRRKDGEYRNIYDKGTFLSDDGKAKRMLGMMSDVTELMLSRMALTQSENRFRSLMNNLNVGVALYDVNMVPVMHNKTAFTLLGMTESQFVGTAAMDNEWNVIDSDGDRMKPEDFPIPMCIKEKKAIKQVVMGVFRPITKDRVWLMVDAEPIYDHNKDLLHVICTYMDFSARKRMEEVLKEKNQQLTASTKEVERRNERLLEFAQIVSHNLRSPLSSIAGLSDLYFNSNEKDQDQAVSYIKDVCKKALETIDDLNKVLKVQQGDRIRSEKLRFEDCLSSVIELMKISLSEKNIVVDADFMQAPVIKYPPIFLENILLNLLSNSIKFCSKTEKPEVIIRTKKIKNTVILYFTDNGLGIDLSKHKEDIFSFGKTFHLNMDSKGVGLFLVKNQIRTMGDEIEVDSKVNEGTTFKIVFKNQYE
ncbi:PAS domain S-box-containing protein [Ekhidna lutea]|uniref:histidine kinase n=1 Tax=Ekhidna lutea TaxID=447679 RepID=A0A239HZH1_EKHLU|nr:HAMP domain-containing sensor histidine kinase [Ekhidna lutea]SNS86770.1 PAS domain S-box-containing protein [Ekhidna lutea]